MSIDHLSTTEGPPLLSKALLCWKWLINRILTEFLLARTSSSPWLQPPNQALPFSLSLKLAFITDSKTVQEEENGCLLHTHLNKIVIQPPSGLQPLPAVNWYPNPGFWINGHWPKAVFYLGPSLGNANRKCYRSTGCIPSIAPSDSSSELSQIRKEKWVPSYAYSINLQFCGSKFSASDCSRRRYVLWLQEGLTRSKITPSWQRGLASKQVYYKAKFQKI